MRKKALRLQAGIQAIPRDGARQKAIEAPELLLMMETLSRWVSYDHRHKTFLTYQVIKIAARVMDMRANRTNWYLKPEWPAIALSMGIDHKTFKVINERAFKWFWWQLGQKGKYSVKWQEQLMGLDKEPPELQPLIVTKPNWTPKVKAQKEHAEAFTEYQNNQMQQEIMEHFFV